MKPNSFALAVRVPMLILSAVLLVGCQSPAHASLSVDALIRRPTPQAAAQANRVF